MTGNRWRQFKPWGAIGFLLVVCLLGTSPGWAQTRPNIVMILVDDMGAGDLNATRMPNCSQLALRGTSLKLYAHQSCMPTRTALLTGQYPHRFNLYQSWPTPVEPGLPVDVKMVPEYLVDAGYQCGIFGKWHLGWQQRSQWPTRRGFSEFIGILGGHINSYGTRQLGTPYADGSIGHDHHNLHDMQWNEVPLYTGKYSTELFSDGASKFIKTQAANEQPFFLYVPFNAPHAPYSAPRRYVAQAMASGEFDESLIDQLDEINGIMMVDRNDRVRRYETSRLLYAAMMLALDDAVKQIYDQLETSGVAENTLFVFASDNGSSYIRDPRLGSPPVEIVGSSGEYRGFKGSPYEGGIRVANFVVWPARIAPQQAISTNVWIGDLAATFVEASGQPVPSTFDGGSLLPTLEQNTDIIRRFGGRRLLPFLRHQAIQSTRFPEIAFVSQAVVVAGNRKYLRTIYLDANRNVLPYRAEELYDLRQRPVEGNNLVNSPTYARWLESGRADLQRFGGDDLLMSLPLIPRSRVWAGFNWTIDFGFPDGDRVLETSLTP